MVFTDTITGYISMKYEAIWDSFKEHLLQQRKTDHKSQLWV